MVNATNKGPGEAVRKACAVDLTDKSITGLRRIWRDLQAYHKARKDKLPEFPFWVLLCEVPQENLKLIIEAVYPCENDYFNRNGLIVTNWGRIDPREPEQRAEKWMFHLFFGDFHQALSKEMTQLAKDLRRRGRTNTESFYTIYSKVKEFRDERIMEETQDRGRNKLRFIPRDFRSYRKYLRQTHPLVDDEDDDDDDFAATDNHPGRGNNPEGTRFSRRLANRHIQCDSIQPATPQANIKDPRQPITIESESDSDDLIENENDDERSAGDVFSNPGTSSDESDVRSASEDPLDDLQGSEENNLLPEPTPDVDEQADKEYEGHISLPTRLSTVQVTADYTPQNATHASAPLPTVLGVDPALDEGCSRDRAPHETQKDSLNNDEDLKADYMHIEALIEAWNESIRSLRKEEDVLKRECQQKLRLREEVRNEWHGVKQRVIDQLSTIAFDDWSGAASYLISKASEDMKHIHNKRKAYDEGITTDNRKKVKVAARIRKIKTVLTQAHITYKEEGNTPTAGGSDGVEQMGSDTGM